MTILFSMSKITEAWILFLCRAPYKIILLKKARFPLVSLTKHVMIVMTKELLIILNDYK